jgi:flagellar basal body-associated protein FliL
MTNIIISVAIAIIILVLAGIGISFLTMHALADYRRNKDVSDSVLQKYLTDMKFKTEKAKAKKTTKAKVVVEEPKPL